MYIEHDFVGPAVLELMAQRRIRNRILRYWPKAFINGVETLDRLYLYRRGSGVQQSVNHTQLYNILGVKTRDLHNQDWRGVETAWLHFRVEWGNRDDLNSVQLRHFVARVAPLTIDSENTRVITRTPPVLDSSVWFTTTLQYETSSSTTGGVQTSAEVLQYVNTHPRELVFSADAHSLTAMALLDKSECMFERVFEIAVTSLRQVAHSGQLNRVLSTMFVRSYTVLMRFRRKPQSIDAEFVHLGAIVQWIAQSNSMLSNTVGRTHSLVVAARGSPFLFLSSLDEQLRQNYASSVPFVNSDIISHLGGTFRYRVAGLRRMKAEEFNQRIIPRITSAHSARQPSWYQRAIAIVFAGIVITLAIIFSPVTGGGSFALAGLILAVGTVAMIGLSVIVAKHDPAWGAYIGKVAVTLGVISSVVGVMSIINSVAQAMAVQAAKQAAKQAGKEFGREALQQTIAQVSIASTWELAREMGLSQLGEVALTLMKQAWVNTTAMTLTNVLRLVTHAFQHYAAVVNPPNKGLAEKEAKISAQEKQLEDLTGPGLQDKIAFAFTSPHGNIYDLNEYVQATPYAMTQGRIDEALSKYYDAVTSRQKYKGYIG